MVSGESKVWAFLAYLLGIVGFILVLLIKKTDRFAMYHAKQSLVLFITYIAVWIISAITGFIPFLGRFVSFILWIVVFVLWIIGMINALKGEEKQLPLIGSFGNKINL